MVDVHAHFSALFAADFVIRQSKPRLFAAFGKAEALLFIFLEIVRRNTEEKDLMRTPLTVGLELLQ